MNQEVYTAENSRSKTIVKTSIIGILANVFLAAFKAVIGLLAHSIAIVMDAVNNLSDAASSLITIIGTKLAGREADKKHPFGYGRIEYLSAMVISVIVLYAGVTSLVESVKAILHPETPDYNTAALTIVGAAVLVKLVLGRYVKGVGEKVNSDSLVNSGQDAMLDSVISASTLAAAIIYLLSGLSLEAWLGAVISFVIIKSGVEMIKETISHLLGEPGDLGLVRAIKSTVVSFPEVMGTYDMILHNYGPDTYQASLHIEIPDTLSADQVDRLVRSITMKVYEKHQVILTAVGIYSVNSRDPEQLTMRANIREIVLSHAYVRELHGFHYDKEAKTVRFDVVISFDAPSRSEAFKEVLADVKKAYPELTLQVAMDTDFTEIEE